MAPTTRLRVQPDQRISYATPGQRGGQRGSHANPIITNPGSPEPITRECEICALPRNVEHFPAEMGVEVCTHLQSYCKFCIGNVIKTNTEDPSRQESSLRCMEPGCEHTLSYHDIKVIVCKEIFERWDAVLAQHYLRASKAFITCLNPGCGHYFSIEDCNGNQAHGREKAVTCPYCEYQFCIDCNRQWHPGTDCDQNLEAENNESEAAMRRLGAKPCPRCNTKIEKTGGCDHMTCTQCRYQFCWMCGIAYSTHMQHEPGCQHRNNAIAQVVGNYFNGPEAATVNAVNNAGRQPRDRPHNARRMPVNRTRSVRETRQQVQEAFEFYSSRGRQNAPATARRMPYTQPRPARENHPRPQVAFPIHPLPRGQHNFANAEPEQNMPAREGHPPQQNVGPMPHMQTPQFQLALQQQHHNAPLQQNLAQNHPLQQNYGFGPHMHLGLQHQGQNADFIQNRISQQNFGLEGQMMLERQELNRQLAPAEALARQPVNAFARQQFTAEESLARQRFAPAEALARQPAHAFARQPANAFARQQFTAEESLARQRFAHVGVLAHQHLEAASVLAHQRFAAVEAHARQELQTANVVALQPLETANALARQHPPTNAVANQNNAVPNQNNIVPNQNNIVPNQNNIVPNQNNIVPNQNNIVPNQNNTAPARPF